MVGSHKCKDLSRDPCECQAELSDIARTAEVSFVSSVCHVLGGHCGTCVNVKPNLAIMHITEAPGLVMTTRLTSG